MSDANKAPAKPKKVKKNIWNTHGLQKRVYTLIQEGLLNSKSGFNKICETINTEFAEQMGDGPKLTQKALAIRVRQLVWTKKVEDDLWRAISHKMENKFREAYTYIPEKMIKEKAKELKGLTHSSVVTEFRAGMGVISDDELAYDAGSFEFPSISHKEPLVISNDAEGQLVIINGSLIGIKFPDIKRNVLRRALADARHRGAAAVVITNLIELWTKKTAGPLAALRAAVSGIQINPERFPADYRKEVKDVLDGKITDKLIYQTLNERFNEILDGIHKIAHRPKGKGPEFTGPVYVTLGIKEEELIFSTAYYKCRYMTIVEQNKIEAELNMASHRRAEALHRGDRVEVEKWDAKVAILGRKKARTIITNTADQQYEFYRRRMRALVVKKLEAAIPNCKVISQGSTYLRVADKTIKIHVPPHAEVTEGLLADYGDNYGIDVMRDTLADLTIVCHPYSLNHRIVGREDSKDGQPVTKFIHVAPSALDSEFLRDEFKNILKVAHPVQKEVTEAQFKPGVLLISWANGIISADNLPISKLDKYEGIARGVQNFAFPYPDIKYITFALNTDNHWGSSAKRFIWDPKQGIHLGVNEAMIEMQRREGMINPADVRVHCICELDDLTDGNLWFKPHYQPHPREMSIIHIEDWLRQMASDIRRAAQQGDNEAVLKMTEEVNRISIAQLYFRGEHFPFHQMMQVYDRHLDPLVDYYSAVLSRFVKSGLVLRGISQINKTMFDTRDVGVLNFPNGNHRVNTLERADLEGEYFARHVQARLGQLPEWQKYQKSHPNFLKETVRAPRFSNVTFGLGTIKAPGGYEWGIRLLNSPPRLSSWSDLLAAFIRSDIARGDSSYGLLKYVTVTFTGDKHFYCKAETDRMIYIICAAGVHTDLYGDIGGFPPNNTGVCFVSIPAGGPEDGPIIVRMLPHDYLRDWFADPKPFNWKKFLPEPV